MRKIAIAFFASMLLPSSLAYAKPIDDLAACAVQKDAKKRLACYDSTARVLVIEERTREEVTARLQQERENEKDLQAKKDAAAKLDERERQILAKQDAAGHDALRALKKLQARTRTGVAYRDYSGAVSEAKLEVETYLEKPSVKLGPEFDAQLTGALADYETANKVWTLKFGGGSVSQWVFFREMDDMLSREYPQMESARQGSSRNIRIDFALPIIWSSASDRISKAAAIIDAGLR